MGDDVWPKQIIMPRKLEGLGQREPGGKEKEWAGCIANHLRVIGTREYWRTPALEPGTWYDTVVDKRERGFMAKGTKGEVTFKAENVVIVPRLIGGELRHLRAALIGQLRGSWKRHRVRQLSDYTLIFFPGRFRCVQIFVKTCCQSSRIL